ncbi:hypothetical protein Vretifemale_12066 [Volvox reticuliferus]|uniref:Peptidase M14 domain-containing protein n=1 Tax=Volvox reticuliferus TaxID=1737510 RepID=A0A8J4CL85_9CHLO|nr:hypothetical protein Vretifemale_12066 [Volvox reticuliferus]
MHWSPGPPLQLRSVVDFQLALLGPTQLLSTDLQNLLATTVMYIVPSMNPDGYIASSRMNANGIDLNRNCYTSDFPFARPSPAAALKGAYYEAAYFLTSGGASMEPESRVITSWLSSIRPTVSSNLHGGALVAGYTLDACDSMGVNLWCESQESPLPNFLANVYAQNNPRMVISKMDPQGLGAFVNGTTQGANWYPSLGTLADWLHHAQRLQMLTLELHNKCEGYRHRTEDCCNIRYESPWHFAFRIPFPVAQ